MGKIALDLVLLAQTEVAEVRAGEGRSSAMPHKQNPVGPMRARACALRVPPLAATLLAAMAQEHERAAGAWHAEWEPLAQAIALTGGAAAAVRETLEQLEVRPERMRANLDATDERMLAERRARASAADVRPRTRRERRRRRRARPRRARPASARRCSLSRRPRTSTPRVDELLDPAGTRRDRR